jgi:Eukaryotic mitochondrial regulator protein
MWYWLRDIGINFRDPLPSSTNYLGAYNSRGELRRAAQNSLAEDGGFPDSKALPRERQSDLTPFPLNPSFRSQPVVDEDIREAIWERVVKEGQSVKAVSADLGIEINRVGAIVRLKEVEKEWIRKVSIFF